MNSVPEAGLQSVSQIQPMLPGSRGQRTERADDALAGTLGGVLRLDEEKVGVGFALVSLGGFAKIHRTLYISYTPGNRSTPNFDHSLQFTQPNFTSMLSFPVIVALHPRRPVF